jgi:molybdate transport system ATP-binding protein
MALEVRVKKALSSFVLDVSLTAERGDLKVITGPSGAGKTTVIRIIAGLERPDEGYITYRGEVWVDRGRGIFMPSQKRRLGFVFQDYTLFPHLTVYQNVAFAAQDRKDVEKLLRLFGIWNVRDSKPNRISGGERQRCAICQNLARKPRVLLLDEPFSALDLENRRRLRRELKALKEKLSIPIIHVTHDLNEALYLGDEVLSMVKGQLDHDWLDDRLEELMEDEMGWLKRRGEGLGKGGLTLAR